MWSLPGRAVRKHCESVLYTIQPRLAQMTCLKLSPISIFYTVSKLFLTVKVTLHLYNSHFHLRFADIGVPTELLSVLVSTLKKTSTVTSEDAYRHPFLDCDCERRAFVCTPCGYRKYVSPLTTPLLSCDLPHIHYWSWLSVAWLP